MDFLSVIGGQILSPPILFFLLGMFAALAGSDLKVPGDISIAMMLFLLTAIGLKGGIGIAKVAIGTVLVPAIVAISLGCGIVLLAFIILRRLKFDAANASSIAGHYGAVSAATMVLGVSYLDGLNISYEPFIPAMYPLMDSPAIITAILVGRMALAKTKEDRKKIHISRLLKDSILGKAVLLLVAAMFIGYLSGEKGASGIMPFFDGMFRGVLCLFMLDMGLLAARRLHDWKIVGGKLAVFALIMPLIHGITGVTLGTLIGGLSIGGATMLGILAGSASYISAPAAMRAAIPEANPSLSLTASIALTFPMNVMIGIPLYYAAAQKLAHFF